MAYMRLAEKEDRKALLDSKEDIDEPYCGTASRAMRRVLRMLVARVGLSRRCPLRSLPPVAIWHEHIEQGPAAGLVAATGPRREAWNSRINLGPLDIAPRSRPRLSAFAKDLAVSADVPIWVIHGHSVEVIVGPPGTRQVISDPLALARLTAS